MSEKDLIHQLLEQSKLPGPALSSEDMKKLVQALLNYEKKLLAVKKE